MLFAARHVANCRRAEQGRCSAKVSHGREVRAGPGEHLRHRDLGDAEYGGARAARPRRSGDEIGVPGVRRPVGDGPTERAAGGDLAADGVPSTPPRRSADVVQRVRTGRGPCARWSSVRDGERGPMVTVASGYARWRQAFEQYTRARPGSVSTIAGRAAHLDTTPQRRDHVAQRAVAPLPTAPYPPADLRHRGSAVTSCRSAPPGSLGSPSPCWGWWCVRRGATGAGCAVLMANSVAIR